MRRPRDATISDARADGVLHCVQVARRAWFIVLIDCKPMNPHQWAGSPGRDNMDGETEDAWGVTGKRVECQSCHGGGHLDGETCPGCLGYGWISSRPSDE